MLLVEAIWVYPRDVVMSMSVVALSLWDIPLVSPWAPAPPRPGVQGCLGCEVSPRVRSNHTGAGLMGVHRSAPGCALALRNSAA